MIKIIIMALCVSLAMMGSANAALKSYDISWTGNNNYTMIGNFSFDAATAGATVDETELNSFFIEGLLNGSSIGSYSGSVENFNFDAIAGAFMVGGGPASTSGQLWNYGETGFGFGSGLSGQAFSLSGDHVIDSRLDVENGTLEATLSTVPLPAALPLYAAGMAVLGVFGYRRKRANLATV